MQAYTKTPVPGRRSPGIGSQGNIGVSRYTSPGYDTAENGVDENGTEGDVGFQKDTLNNGRPQTAGREYGKPGGG